MQGKKWAKTTGLFYFCTVAFFSLNQSILGMLCFRRMPVLHITISTQRLNFE